MSPSYLNVILQNHELKFNLYWVEALFVFLGVCARRKFEICATQMINVNIRILIIAIEKLQLRQIAFFL